MDYTLTLESLRSKGNLRTIPSGDSAGVIDFSQNDYLGIGASGLLQREFMESEENRDIPLTSSASRLLANYQSEYSALEDALARVYGRPALLFNSGYHANTGLVSALADSDTLIVADKLVHASIIDGIQLSKAPFERWRHNDVNHLEKILAKNADKYGRMLIIAESVYSMDGDTAPLDDIAALRRRYDNAMLYVDEAHAVGVAGKNGEGVVSTTTDPESVDILVGTFGKAFASCGAFAILSDTSRSMAINRARSFIFSTAIPPINCAYTRFVLDRMPSLDKERTHLMTLSSTLRDRLGAIGIEVTENPQYILPVIIGNAAKTVEISRKLLEYGVKVLPIRTPTVPPGTERLRISLSAAMTEHDITLLADALAATL